MLIDDRTVQTALKKAGLYLGRIDGDFGTQSLAAARRRAAAVAPGYKSAWSDDRVRLAVEQEIFKAHGFYGSAIDGLNGPATQVAVERWQDHVQFHADERDLDLVPQVWPRQSELRKFYGEPGANQAMLVSPYPLYLDWDLSTPIKRFSIHEKCHDSALRVMRRVLDHYGPERLHDLGLDQFGGCLNVRKMRNGSSWSTHAWGIAIDWDADRNQLRWTRANARMARAEYAPFLDLWQAEGWLSLGRAKNFDWMHVQAARL